LLISIDTLRADHLGCYGYERDTSPAIDRLAAEGVLFEHAYSTSNWTLTAHVSMLSGLYPAEHGVLGYRHVIDPRIELLPEALAPLGYRSAGVVSTVSFLQAQHGFRQGWETYDDHTAYSSSLKGRRRFVSSELVYRRAIELLDGLGKGPFLLFVHFFDAHIAYVPPTPYNHFWAAPSAATESDLAAALALRPAAGQPIAGSPTILRQPTDRGVPHLKLESELESRRAQLERLAARYDGEIRWVDLWLGRLFDELRRRGLYDDMMIAVVSDHGEEFGEHGQLRHHNNLFDETVHVPMIVRSPGGRFAGHRVAAPASLVDVPATLLAAAGRRPSQFASGTDLLRRLDSSAPARDLFVIGERDGQSNKFLGAIIDDRRRAIFALTGAKPSRRPIDLQQLSGETPGLETAPIAELRRRLAAALDEQFRRRSLHPPGKIARRNAEERAALRALGYL